MTRTVVIEPEADEDLSRAFAWYEETSPAASTGERGGSSAFAVARGVGSIGSVTEAA